MFSFDSFAQDCVFLLTNLSTVQVRIERKEGRKAGHRGLENAKTHPSVPH